MGTLAGACVATGIAGTVMLRRVVAPAAAVLSHGAEWAGAVLAGHGRVPTVPIPFDYASPAELAATAGTVLIGLMLLWRYGHRAEVLRTRLTAIATGSVNDYTAYLAVGTVVSCLAMAL